MPLTNYRLGAGGINQLMEMEASTGISGRQQASSVEAMRTLSGYTMSTADVTNQIGSLASAGTANRMFMMGGIGMVGVGGKQGTLMSVMKNIVKAAGLDNEKVLNSAFAPGSVTRAKLANMGVPPDMITEVLQYAKANLQFKGKGGTGMYDPGLEKDRRRMGIEENFATQAEETTRLETQREEKFYRRQADNYAYLERQTQTLTKAFGALEDTLSGIIGFTGSNRIANETMNGIMNVGGGDPHIPQTGDGNKSNPQTTPTSSSKTKAPANASNDGKIYVPLGNGKRVSLSHIKQRQDFKGMNPQMQERLLNLMRDNPDVGWGGGTRDIQAQKNMFLSRYNRTQREKGADGKKNWFWDGSYWEKNPGANPAAPPGSSMHEIGLAADLAGNVAKVPKIAAKYGLKSFGDKNGEPWHVQPRELPDGRKSYESGGAKWGYGPGKPSSETTAGDAGNMGGFENEFGSTVGPRRPTPMSSNTVSDAADGSFGTSLAASSISSKLSYKTISQRVASGGGDPEITTPVNSMGSPVYNPNNTANQQTEVHSKQSNLTINVKPTINMISSNNNQMDLKKIANELVGVIRKEMELELMRKR
jgi:hypothetical protein